MNIQALRRQVAETSRRVWEKGWVANHDGNITVRVDGGRLLATPTAVSKGAIREEDVLLLDGGTGAVIAGSGRSFELTTTAVQPVASTGATTLTASPRARRVSAIT